MSVKITSLTGIALILAAHAGRPSATKETVIRALEMLQNKTDTNPPKKHGNIPLQRGNGRGEMGNEDAPSRSS